MTRLRGVLAAGILGALLVGCSTAEEAPEPERGILSAQTTLPEAEVDQLALPLAFQELPTFTLPFDSAPETADGVLFGLQEVDGILEFAAVDTAGHTLWSTQRPAACSGFTLSSGGEAPSAVLTDVASTSDALAEVTASAYNLHTGELQWGPVPVAGPWQGPGTVFAEAAPASAMGETGPREVLDPRTGEVLPIEGEIIGEFDGTVLTTSAPASSSEGAGATVAARGANDWEIFLEDLVTDADGLGSDATVTALPGAEHPPGFALLRVDGADEAALVDLTDGTVLSTRATSATWDPAADILIAAEPGILAGYDADGPIWSQEIAEDLQIAASGGVLTYLRSESAVQVVNAVTGEHAVGYDPEATSFAVPTQITADGAAVFNLDGPILVGTHGQP